MDNGRIPKHKLKWVYNKHKRAHYAAYDKGPTWEIISTSKNQWTVFKDGDYKGDHTLVDGAKTIAEALERTGL